MTHSFPTRRSSELAGAVEMNVTRICDFLRPTITADGVTGRYVEVHAARSLEPDLQDRDAGLPLCLVRSEEHTSELQSLMRISYAVFCLKKKKKTQHESKNISRLLLRHNNID